MKVAVRYYTKSGNTKKLADAVAEVLNVESLSVSEPLSERVDVLVLGSSVYAAGVDQAIIDFLKNNAKNIGKIVNISTAALLPSTYKQVKKLADENGISIAEEEFHCKGEFGPMHKGRPNAEDVANVKAFASKLVIE